MLTDDDIRKFGFESGLLRIEGTTITRWKDGIDIDYPVQAVERFARAVERAAYEAAIKACDKIAGNHRQFSDERRKGAGMCSAEISALMQEQPK